MEPQPIEQPLLELITAIAKCRDILTEWNHDNSDSADRECIKRISTVLNDDELMIIVNKELYK